MKNVTDTKKFPKRGKGTSNKSFKEKNKNFKNNKESNIKEDKIDEKGSIICGRNTVLESINNQEIAKVYLQKGLRISDIKDELISKNIPYIFTEKKYLDTLTEGANHQGVAALVSAKEFLDLEDLIVKNKSKANPMIIMLDEVQDPHNLGAILRIADAFGIDGLIINKRRNVQLTSTVAKVSTGAIDYVDIVRSNNLRQSLQKLKKEGYWVACLDMVADYKLEDFDFNLPLVVVIGGEDKGITNVMKKECDFSITIPMFGHVNSLNVASATSVLCYQKSISKK